MSSLVAQALHVRRKTLELHRRAPEVRIASSLSCVELLCALWYGGLLEITPRGTGKDRFIASKGHGTIALYPILADLGFFPPHELEKIGSNDALLGAIPDATIPGFITTNGSLGHGPGVACGMALALKRKKEGGRVVVLTGDGELNAGSIWEAVMFAAFHQLDNLLLVVDDNGISMLGHQADILGLRPLTPRFAAFGWQAWEVDGHDPEAIHQTVSAIMRDPTPRPRVLIAKTIKGKGVEELEDAPLCHVASLKPERIERLLQELP